jgi:regulatory protein
MKTAKKKQPLTVSELKNYAMGLLAGREYGAQELLHKMAARSDQAQAESILAWLQEQRLQSDERFASMLLRSKASRGQGPLRIRQEMQQKRLCPDAMEQAFNEFDGDWFELALNAYEKKFRQPPGPDRKERARRQRFLAYRGYSGDQIAYALEQGHQECTNQP